MKHIDSTGVYRNSTIYNTGSFSWDSHVSPTKIKILCWSVWFGVTQHLVWQTSEADDASKLHSRPTRIGDSPSNLIIQCQQYCTKWMITDTFSLTVIYVAVPCTTLQMTHHKTLNKFFFWNSDMHCPAEVPRNHPMQ